MKTYKVKLYRQTTHFYNGKVKARNKKEAEEKFDIIIFSGKYDGKLYDEKDEYEIKEDLKK